METRVFSNQRHTHTAAVSTKVNVKSPMKWLLLMAVMLLPGLVGAQTVLGAWTLSGSSVSRTISCGTTYTFTGSISSSTNSTHDSYCTISSSTSCPITVTLTARSLSTEDQDYVYVYDGSGTDGTLLDTWSQSTPTGLSVTSASGTITIRFDHNKKKRANSFTVRLYQSCSCATPSTSYSCTGGKSSYQIGSGTSSSVTYGPVNNYYNRSYRQILYTSEEFDYRSGDIQAIAFQYAGSSAVTHAGDVTVYMANTNVQQFASTTSWITSGLTQVYHGNMNFQSSGWAWITLDSPFSYTGGNLLMVIDDNSGKYDGSGYTFNYSGASSGPTMQLYQQSDADTCDFSNTSLPTSGYAGTNYRPNTKFCIEHNCEVRPGTFEFTTPSVSLTAGESYTQDVTGGSGVTYAMTCNPTGIATFNSSTHTVSTVAGSEGTVTVTATWPADDTYCKRTTSYTISVGDGCAQVGNGTSTTTSAPIYSSSYTDYYSYTQQVYTAAEILAAGGCQGKINDIKFQYSTESSFNQPLQLFVGFTQQSSLSSAWISDASLQQVYSGTVTFTQGWTTIHLTNPIDWNGVDNIVVAVKTTSAPSGTYRYFYYTSVTGGGRYCYSSSSQIALNGSNVPSSETGYSYGYRPNIRFCIDCCDDNLTGDFHFRYESINYVAGSGAPTANDLINGTGQTTGISYTPSNTDYITVSSSGVVSMSNNIPEGDYVITAKLTNANGCDRYARYTIHVTDGCTQIGNGTSTYYMTPVYNSGTSGYYSYTQQLYKASEIIAAGGCQGKINDIKFQYSTTSSFSQGIQVYMGSTQQTSLSSAWISDAGLQLVYSGTPTFTTGWTTIHLTTPYDWNGVDNIVVAVKTTGSSGSTSRYFYYNSTTGGARYSYSSSAAIALGSNNVPSSETGYSTTYRPNIRFCIDCCDDIVTETFAYDTPTEVEYVIGSGAFTPPHLTNNTGMTSITYSCSSDAENGSSVGSVNATTGAVTFTGNEGYLTVVAKLAVPNGCDKYTKYRVWVNDGCRRVGTGTVTGSASIIDAYKYDWTQFIYKGSEINGGGTINRISVRAVSDGSLSRTIKIYMCLTDKTSFSSSTDFIPLADMTQVYSGTRTLSAGWNDFNLSRNFSVPCGKNLIIAFDIDASDYATEYFYATNISGSGIRAHSDTYNAPVADMSSYSGYTELIAYRPNIKLCMTECVCPELSFAQQSVVFCTNGTPQHPELTCESSGAKTWRSSDPDVVRIDNATTGAMTIRGTGRCVIYLDVAATGQYCAASASYNVRVIENCPTLTYDLSNCTGTATPSSIPSLTAYGIVSLSDVVPSCSAAGMTFAGWCVSEDGNGSIYQPGSNFPLTHDTTLYAVFYTRCCHPDSSTVSYLHQTVTINGDSYSVNPDQSIEVERSDDGFFYYDLCLGEGDGKIHASVNLPDGCNYTNQSWKLEYADGTTLVTNSTGNTFEHVIDSVIGYGLTYRARSNDGCWLQLNGRIRVSPGINVTSATVESFSVCPESYAPISIGLSDEEGVQVEVNRPGTSIESTLGHADKIFLPDGVACDVNGDGNADCKYVSAVNFTDFQNGSVIRSVEDILYLSMSLEHTYIGDLFISLTCPDGKVAVIHPKHRNESYTSCLTDLDTISHPGYMATLTNNSNDFGIPNTGNTYSGSEYVCDSTYSSNAMGTPWTYAWSNNTTRGYGYAGGTYGHIYESENYGHCGATYSVDSSDLISMTQIYHPYESFESLVGCPLNGVWYITVIDAWSGDNGYLVDWQLALSEDLAGDFWNYQVDLDTAFMSCTLTNNSKSVTIHTPEIPEAGDYDCNLVLVDKFGCLNDNELNYHFNIKDITVSVSTTGADCGQDNGQISASVTNGGCGPDAVYTYTLVSSGGETTENTSGSFPHLYGGDYHLTVRCEDGCTKELDINVPTTGTVGIELDGTVAETCADANDGQINVHVTGSGSGNYTFNTNTGGYSCTDGHFIGVEPGTYSVTVTDNGTGCTGTVNNVVVAEATALTLTLTMPDQDGSCPLADGSNYNVTANPAGGTGSYQNYTWSVVTDGSAGTISGTGNTATIASDGTCHEYVVSLSLKDGNNCPASANGSFITIDGTKPVIATTATNNQDWGCDPTNVVAPTFTATDNCPTAGTALTPTVTTDGPQGTGCEKTQTWRANVTDNCDNDAVEKTITYTWTESQAPTIDAIADQPAEMGTSGCKYKMIDLEEVSMAAAHDGCGGTVTFVSQSVEVGHEYTQTNTQQSIPVTVIVKGTCDKQATATVNVIIPANDITVSIDQTAASVCTGGDTTLTATGSSSNGTPTYAWTPTTGLTPTTGASVTATVSDETTYTVTATDPAGCTATDQITVTINPEVSLSVSPTSQEKCLGVAIDPVTITVTNGTIDNEAALQAAVEALGLTYNNGAISGTPNAPGVHTFDFTAVSNQIPQCSAVDGSFTIDVTNLINPVIAGDEDICVTASEANTVLSLSETAGNNTFTYNWNVGDNGTIITGQGTNAITAQWSSAGDKTVTVTLTLDECSAQATKTIHVRPVPTATIAEVTDDVCPNAGTIDITGTNTATTADYTYTWGGTLSLNHTTATVSDPTDVATATIPSDDCDATYNVTLNVVDNYGCKNTATPITVTVRDDEAPQVTGTMPDKDVEGCSVAQLSTLYPAATSVAELEAAATALGGSLAVSDNCTTDKSQLTLQMVGQTNTGSCPIVVTRKYVVKDQCNKVSDTISQTIHINMANDITIPVVSQSSTVDCESMAVADAITLPTVTNACGEELLPIGAPSVNNGVTNCNGDKTFTYTYKDCADHERTWEYTFTVIHPNLSVPADSVSNIGCLEDTSNTFLPRSITDACNNAVVAELVDNPDMSGYDALADAGDVVFHYRYTDCAGAEYPWNLTYRIAPSSFTPTTNGASTVSCIGLATSQSPEPRVVCGVDVVYTANPANPIDTPSDIAAAGGCGTRVYEYTYNVHGTDYTWTYTYTIRPDSIVFAGNVPTRDTVECNDPSFTPTLPTVTTNCGLGVDTTLTETGTYTDCDGTRIWNYTFTDCAGNSRNWTFTRVIKHTSRPHLTYRPAETTKNVECLAEATKPTDLPTVVDVCGNSLNDAAHMVHDTIEDLHNGGCSGTRTFRFTYTDCAGLDTVWTYTYNILRTTPPAEKPDGVDGYVTVPAASTVQCLDLATTPTQLPTVLDVCGNVLEPLPGSGEYFDTIEDCEGSRTYKYNYKDCQQLTYQWIYKYTIDRTDLPEEQGTPVIASMPVACESHAIIDSIAAMPVVQDACGEILQPVNANPTADMTAFADCHGQIKYDFLYRDCAGLEFPWTFTFEVDMPASAPLAAGDSTVYCESYAVENEIPFPTHQFACGGSHTISPADQTSVENNVAGGTGTIIYHYGYSDCENNTYTWDFTYNVTPAAVTNPADEHETVYCVSSVQTPTLPVLPVCDVDVFGSATLTFESDGVSDGCGDTTFVYHYNVNGAAAEWRYHYHVQPGDFTLPADVVVNVECYNDEQPAAALVPVVAANDSICEAINPSAPVRNADGTDTYDGCQGTVSWTYSYSNCSHTHTWKYTYNVQRTTVPQVSDVPIGSYVTCANLADGNFTLPTVTDACGADIAAPVPVITPDNPTNCNSTKVYTYTYVDPCNANLTSQFVYTYTINDTVRPGITSIPANEIPAAIPAGSCQYQIPSLEAVVMNYANETCSTPIWGGQMPAAGEVYSAQPTATPVSVVVTVRDECNNARTMTINVTIPANSLQLPTIAGVPICDGDTATLTASPTTAAEAMPINCEWTTGTTTIAQGAAPLSIEVAPAVNTTYNVTATDAAGCTASRSVVVSVNHPTHTAFTQTVCEGYTWSNHGWSATYNTSGTYTHAYTTAQGCPSTDTLHLTVYTNSNTEYTETACDSYTWSNHGWNQTYTTSGDYQHSYSTPDGCQSVDVLHLTVNHNTSTLMSETACDSYTWNNHGWSQTYTTSGVYNHDYMSADGCPSTDVLTLTINRSATGSISVRECESYTWYGQNYNMSGDYQHHLTTSHGCDSLVTLYLTIINAYYTDLYDTVCYGAPYTWYDNTYTGNGTHTHTLVSSDGCDSVLTMHLHQLPVVRVGIDETHNCRTGQYTLLASSINSDQYEWWSEPDNGEIASQSRENEITVMPLVTTTYYAKAWPAGHEECSATTSRILDPVKMARAAIDAHPAYLTIDRTEWNATDRSGGADWKAWYVDGVYYGDGHHISDQIVPPIDSLSIVLIVGTEECADTARRTIPYINAGLWVPNAFTPSQDNNNYFGAIGTGIHNYKMWVYTREGLLVFYSDSMGDKWDGTHDGKKCPQGTYTYRILYSTVAEPESEMEEVGTVTILR
ncbi:MAG: gliding motility-associated C-terminal domain-containing protein [Bacteroidales bacterium]|nr:gliding motility-associated C-terminal domain-containing protein [Bacteroidales bacterium]